MNLPLILMSPFMILLVTDTGENTRAIFALIGLLPSMSPEMHHQVALLGEGPLAIRMRAFEQLQARMHRLQVKFQPVPAGELFHTAREGARYQGILKMRPLMVLEVLLELELLPTVLAGEVSQRQLLGV
jgi:hypothetical protein